MWDQFQPKSLWSYTRYAANSGILDPNTKRCEGEDLKKVRMHYFGALFRDFGNLARGKSGPKCLNQKK